MEHYIVVREALYPKGDLGNCRHSVLKDKLFHKREPKYLKLFLPYYIVSAIWSRYIYI